MVDPEYQIRVSAHREDEEAWRLERLLRVVFAIGALANFRDTVVIGTTTWPSMTPYRIVSVHDHKGVLTVEWVTAPSEAERELVAKVWDDENECTIEHHVVLERGET
jgi:hypothetical protein